MSASVGGILKDYRTQKRIPKKDILRVLGWKNDRELTKIEQGTAEKSTRSVIEKICRALQLNEIERNNLLLAGNYLPTKKEIDAIRRKYAKYIEEWPYSAVVYDFCWRVMLLNTKIMKLLRIPNEEERQSIYRKTPTAIEIIFDPKYTQNRYLVGEEVDAWHKNLLRFLTHFKNLQKSITRDKWYIATIRRMMDNELFRTLWLKVQHGETEIVTTRYGKKIFVHPEDTKKRLYFNIFVAPLYKDPRFELEFFSPSDDQTAAYFKP